MNNEGWSFCDDCGERIPDDEYEEYGGVCSECDKKEVVCNQCDVTDFKDCKCGLDGRDRK